MGQLSEESPEILWIIHMVGVQKLLDILELHEG